MTKTLRWLGLLSGIAVAAVLGASSVTYASDHDDGETDLKGRALNLTDIYSFTNNGNLILIMYFNPRSMPDIQYFLSSNAHYEMHLSKAATDSGTPTLADDYLLQFSAVAPDATGAQAITLNVFEGGTMVGTVAGSSTTFAASQANTNLVINSGTAGTLPVTYFVGMRYDSFFFDVQRYFQVRSFLANRFFGSAGAPNASATLEPTCDGHTFFDGSASSNGDAIHLFNPPSCAPDFTHNYNVISIAVSIPLSSLSGSVFDYWATITALQ